MSPDEPTADPAAPAAPWEPAGPSSDDPPWSDRDRGEDASERADDPAADDADEGGPRGSSGGGDRPAAGDEDVPRQAGHLAGGPGAALAELGPSGAPAVPRPPRRTGVFVEPEDLREHVGGLLRTFLGGYQVDAWGNFTFTHEDARIFVTVGMSPIGPQVGVFSVTNLDVELTPQLGGFLLTSNHQLGFGSFSYDADNRAVWLRHTLLGTTLDGPELQSAVVAVASSAARFDDVIRDRFGGRAFHDAPQDVQDRTKPPEPGGPGRPGASGYL